MFSGLKGNDTRWKPESVGKNEDTRNEKYEDKF